MLATRLPLAETDVLHITDTRLLAAGGTEMLTEAILKEQSDSIYTMAKEYLGAGVRYIEEYGIPQAEIDRFISNSQYDLVIIGTRGRSLLASVTLGSVAEHLLHHIQKPLMVVP